VALTLPKYESDQLVSLIGNKRAIIQQLKVIFESLTKTIKNPIFLDPFCGTGAVSRIAKQLQMKVYASDIEYFSYIINSVFLTISAQQLSKMFINTGGIDSFYSLLNYHGLYAAKSSTGINRPYLSRYYAPADETEEGKRLFFTPVNARFFDAVREELEATFIEERINESEKNVVLSTLLYEVSRKANTSGTFSSYHKSLKNVRSRIADVAQLNVPTLCDENSLTSVVKNRDALTFLKEYSGDICYLDPPASVVQYGSAYHLLNSVALWDYYEPSDEKDEKGVLVDKAGIRDDWKKSHSLFCSLKDADKAFVQLFGAVDARHIVLTYPNNALIQPNRVVELLKARHSPVTIIPLYKQNSGGIQSKGGKQNLINIYITGKTKSPYYPVQVSLEMLPLFKRLDYLSTKIFNEMESCQTFKFIGGVVLETPLQSSKIVQLSDSEIEKRIKEFEEGIIEDPQEAFKVVLKAMNEQKSSKEKLKLEKILTSLARQSDLQSLAEFENDKTAKRILKRAQNSVYGDKYET